MVSYVVNYVGGDACMHHKAATEPLFPPLRSSVRNSNESGNVKFNNVARHDTTRHGTHARTKLPIHTTVETKQTNVGWR